MAEITDAEFREKLGRGPMRRAFVIQARAEGRTFTALGRLLGVSTERVRQIHAAGERGQRVLARRQAIPFACNHSTDPGA